jgi:hypothetical protein
VRQRTVRARCDDRGEARGLGAEAAHPQLQLDRDIALAATDETIFEHTSQRLVGELARGADARGLAGVLDRAQLSHGARAADELPGLTQQLAQPPMRLDRDARVVESQPSLLLGERSRDRLRQLTGHDLARERIGYLNGGLGGVAEVRVEAVRSQLCRETRTEHERQRVAAGETGEIAHVHERLHQQRVHAERIQATHEALHASQPIARARRPAHTRVPSLTS